MTEDTPIKSLSQKLLANVVQWQVDQSTGAQGVVDHLPFNVSLPKDIIGLGDGELTMLEENGLIQPEEAFRKFASFNPQAVFKAAGWKRADAEEAAKKLPHRPYDRHSGYTQINEQSVQGATMMTPGQFAQVSALSAASNDTDTKLSHEQLQRLATALKIYRDNNVAVGVGVLNKALGADWRDQLEGFCKQDPTYGPDNRPVHQVELAFLTQCKGNYRPPRPGARHH